MRILMQSNQSRNFGDFWFWTNEHLRFEWCIILWMLEKNKKVPPEAIGEKGEYQEYKNMCVFYWNIFDELRFCANENLQFYLMCAFEEKVGSNVKRDE